MRPVILESPYAGDVDANLTYLRACLRDCLLRGDAPIASHGLYTQPGVLRDEIPEERALGMKAGFAWIARAVATVVYTDRGISGGMKAGIKKAEKAGLAIEYRTLGSAAQPKIVEDERLARVLGSPLALLNRLRKHKIDITFEDLFDCVTTEEEATATFAYLDALENHPDDTVDVPAWLVLYLVSRATPVQP